jgi:hypothetical protein
MFGGRVVPESMALVARFSRRSRLAPRAQVDRAHHHAEYIGRDEAQLVCFEADNTYEYAIDASQRPSFPAPPPHQNRGRDGQYAG